MSYSEHPEMGGVEPRSYMPLDIAALQRLYGAGSGNPGNDVYAMGALDDVVATIWDSGGHDVVDASASTRPVAIDLGPGAYSSLGVIGGRYAAKNNVAVAYGVTLEDARGGGGNDRLAGNGAGNRLDGGAGDDTLSGGAGPDVFVFRAGGGDDLVLDFADGVDLLDFGPDGPGFAGLSASATPEGLRLAFGASSVVLAGFDATLFDARDLVDHGLA
jgi:serralysin